MQKLKINDEVIVTAGKNKGKTGKLTKLNFKKNVAIVEGLNIVKKTMKPTQENPNGGFADMESPIHLSNISLVHPETKKATKVRIDIKDGKHIRVTSGKIKPGVVIE